MRTALVTGASRGIGRAIAQRLELNGHTVLTPSREELDLSDIESIRAFVSQNEALVDILVNNAAVNPVREIPNLTLDQWELTFRVNLTGPMLLMQHFMPGMAARSWGRVLNIISSYSFVSRPGRAAYASSKTGLLALTRTAALEFAERNVLVNAVSPGFVDTEMTRQNNSRSEIELIESWIPMRRLATPEEIAGAVSFLVSDQNTYITGQTLVVDGGFLCQ